MIYLLLEPNWDIQNSSSSIEDDKLWGIKWGWGGIHKSFMRGKIRIYTSYSFKKGMLCLIPRCHSKDTPSVSLLSQIWYINKNSTGAHDNVRSFSLHKFSFRRICNFPLGDIYMFNLYLLSSDIKGLCSFFFFFF